MRLEAKFQTTENMSAGLNSLRFDYNLSKSIEHDLLRCRFGVTTEANS